MTSWMIDDGITLRFHLARGLKDSPYVKPSQSALTFLWRSRIWCAVIVVCDLLGLYMAFHGSYASLPLFILPKLLAWNADRRNSQIEADIRRPSLWSEMAYQVARHIPRAPFASSSQIEHGHDLMDALLRVSRSSSRPLNQADILRIFALAGATTPRNQMLVLSYLQLLLLARAEKLRVESLHDSDHLDDEELRELRQSVRRLPHRGRRPVSLAGNTRPDVRIRSKRGK